MTSQPSEKIMKPPFPPLTGESDSLEGKDYFVSWQGFQANDEHLSGDLRVIVILENAGSVPSVAQTNAYRFLKENEALVTASVLRGLYADYPQIREVYGGIEPEYLPTIEQAEDLRRVIKPINIYINSKAEDGFAYIGFEFDCLWDIEHGLGVMMHRDTYIGCNDAEAAWNVDLARS